MMLTEETSVASAALPLAALKDHLRLGSGFADDTLQDSLIESYLRAAMSAIEGRTGKALMTRRFKLSLRDWRDASEQALPVAPVSAIVSVTLVDAAGGSTVLGTDRYRLVQDNSRPKLASKGYLLPMVPTEGRVDILFDAGFGSIWAAVPPDLQQAAFLLAAQFYETRNDFTGVQAGLPYPVVALIERWRTVRVLGGGAA